MQQDQDMVAQNVSKGEKSVRRWAIVLLLPLFALTPISSKAGQEQMPMGTTAQQSDGQVDAARQDLAARLGMTADEIELVSSEDVTWRDGSMGCPSPGMAYTQALVAGSRVILRANGKLYHYHSGRDRQLFYCANPQTPAPHKDA